jgi:hypothetical protein
MSIFSLLLRLLLLLFFGIRLLDFLFWAGFSFLWHYYNWIESFFANINTVYSILSLQWWLKAWKSKSYFQLPHTIKDSSKMILFLSDERYFFSYYFSILSTMIIESIIFIYSRLSSRAGLGLVIFIWVSSLASQIVKRGKWLSPLFGWIGLMKLWVCRLTWTKFALEEFTYILLLCDAWLN